MNTGLVKYEPMMRIKTFSWEEYFFPKSRLSAFNEAIEKKKFVQLQGSTVNVASIDTVSPVWTSGDFVIDRLRTLDTDVQRKVRNEIKLRKSKIHTDLTPWVLENIISKFNEKEHNIPTKTS